MPGIEVHQTDRLDNPTTIDGIRVCSVERAIIDSAPLVNRKQLAFYVENALFLRLTSFARLRRNVTAIAKRGRRGVGIIRELLDTYDPTFEKTQMTQLEREVLAGMSELDMPVPAKQFEVKLDGRTYYLDFAYPELKIGIEAHSVAWHTRLLAFEKDAERDAALTVDGWRVFYVTKQGMELRLRQLKRLLPPNFLRKTTA
jgi:very-short-patch-repair endonuclease